MLLLYEMVIKKESIRYNTNLPDKTLIYPIKHESTR